MATLTGRIEAIGVLELLRVPITNESTGKLVVFDDHSDAELYYDGGRLVYATAAGTEGSESLREVLGWSSGEFEFIPGAEAAPELHLEGLQEELLGSIKQWYAMRSSKRTASGTMVAPEPMVPRPAPRLVQTTTTVGGGAVGGGARRVLDEESEDSSRASGARRVQVKSQPPPVPKSRRPPAESVRPALPTHRGLVDRGGHLLQRSGNFNPQDAEIAALVQNLGSTMGNKLGAGRLLAAEVRGDGDKWLFIRERGESILAAIVPPDSDFPEVFPEVDA